MDLFSVSLVDSDEFNHGLRTTDGYIAHFGLSLPKTRLILAPI